MICAEACPLPRLFSLLTFLLLEVSEIKPRAMRNSSLKQNMKFVIKIYWFLSCTSRENTMHSNNQSWERQSRKNQLAAQAGYTFLANSTSFTVLPNIKGIFSPLFINFSVCPERGTPRNSRFEAGVPREQGHSNRDLERGQKAHNYHAALSSSLHNSQEVKGWV